MNHAARFIFTDRWAIRFRAVIDFIYRWGWVPITLLGAGLLWASSRGAI